MNHEIRRCPKCMKISMQVNDSREREKGKAIYRRRKCIACGEITRSVEITEERYHQLIANEKKYEQLAELIRETVTK